MLEVMLYHYTAVKESKGLLTEIIDYCNKKIVGQISEAVKRRLREREMRKDAKDDRQEGSGVEMKERRIKERVGLSEEEEFINQVNEIEFSIFIMCISMVKYVSDYVRELEIGVVYQLII
jgi:hypothetical protein